MFSFSLFSWIERLPSAGRYALIGLTALLISCLHPNPTSFRYEFEKGQAWRYADLAAPIDYAIEKPEAEVRREINNVKLHAPAYFQYQPNVEQDLTKHFVEQFTQYARATNSAEQLPPAVRNDTARYLRYGRRILHHVYQMGILQQSDSVVQTGYGVQVVRNNVAEEQAIDQFRDLEQAAALLRDSVQQSSLPDVTALLPFLKDALQPNIVYSGSLTARSRQQQLSDISSYRGMVRKGEIIATKGNAITEEVYLKLLSLRHFYEKDTKFSHNSWWFFVGYALLTAIVLGLFTWFLRLNFPKVLGNVRHLSFLLLLILAYAYLVYLFDSAQLVTIYAIPFCIVPILVSNFYGNRMALVTHFVIILIASYLSTLTNVFTFTFIQCMAGMAAVLSKSGTRSWSRFFIAIEYIFLAYFVSFIALSLIREGNWQTIDWGTLTWLGLSVFLTLLANPLVPIVERIFGYTSDVTLLELSDLEHPLLREMSIQAPGTLQHSLQVANLAEAAASAVGANALLVRVGALYHDIGKMVQPTFYIENQTGESPHEGLTALESATVIIQHVTKGAKMAKKYGLPQILIDFIWTHHGTTRVEYFWQQHKVENPDAADTEFRYPGPRPQTREAAIMMLADSTEAAAKSLKEPNGAEIDRIVDSIFAQKMQLQQLDECNLSFRDLEITRIVFKKLLRSIYHIRIEYPSEK
jgi:cyclic-di-AMP phosphodiesterase PgpH